MCLFIVLVSVIHIRDLPHMSDHPWQSVHIGEWETKKSVINSVPACFIAGYSGWIISLGNPWFQYFRSFLLCWLDPSKKILQICCLDNKVKRDKWGEHRRSQDSTCIPAFSKVPVLGDDESPAQSLYFPSTENTFPIFCQVMGGLVLQCIERKGELGRFHYFLM